VLFAEGAITIIDRPPYGAPLTVWSIRLAVALYFLALAELLMHRSLRARRWWTIGCLACWAHIGLAMHFAHGWSHAAAYADTARQTRETTGLNWGGGIYFNYVFATAWLADVGWWWLSPISRAKRSTGLAWLLHGYLAFILFNATVVFESGPTRWATLAACAGLLLLASLISCRRPPAPPLPTVSPPVRRTGSGG
jgi:hypothetical protein